MIKGRSKAGNPYFLIQDAPGLFHVTLQMNNSYYYDLFEKVTDQSDLDKRIEELERSFKRLSNINADNEKQEETDESNNVKDFII
jgi:uncharacterized protein YdcH (DUF465 family)